MITDKSKLKGTCYFEILPGRFLGQFWNLQSVYFEEQHFSFIEFFLLRRCPKYDHYAFTDINQTLWEEILNDLQQLRKNIQQRSQGSISQDDFSLMISSGNIQFPKEKPESMTALSNMLNDFIKWVQDTLKSHDSIAVLGL
ncbi:hypothetical protein Enr17x_60870 [Gimesia fumaroli]|uniref:Uncharacterized protein n=2 Tax=Gimesia fumaroli TaxID=2527976 RepID=A0A518ILN7_9PLAN|nr:hypothetical protein Enr17x_60870 [Gimesia fumaroli]